MSDTLRVSGKKFSLSSFSDPSSLKWERRPGGWIVFTFSSGERLRFAASELRGRLSFAITSAKESFSGSGDVIVQSHSAGAGSAQSSIDADLTAQFPGKIRKVLVDSGSRVAAGDPLILVEAMKMEFAIKAPVSGKISALRVVEGQQISPGDRFVDFEADAVTQGNSNGRE